MNRQIDRQTYIRTDKQRQRQIETDRLRKGDRHTDTQTCRHVRQTDTDRQERAGKGNGDSQIRSGKYCQWGEKIIVLGITLGTITQVKIQKKGNLFGKQQKYRNDNSPDKGEGKQTKDTLHNKANEQKDNLNDKTNGQKNNTKDKFVSKKEN